MPFRRLFCALAATVLIAAGAELTPEQRNRNAESFEYAWSTIQKFMWSPLPAGVDWQQVHDELKPKAAAAKTMDEARAAMMEMISRLKMTHFNIVPADVYERLDSGKSHHGEGGSPGFDIRLLDGVATVVSVEAKSPAYSEGVRPGWGVLRVDGADIGDLVLKAQHAMRNSTFKDLMITRAVLAKFDGAPGAKVPSEFLDSGDRHVKLHLQLTEPRGAASKFGFLPEQHVWYESKKLGNTGYIAFNMFLDPARISNQFSESVRACAKCDGIVIDLRGNPGGIGGMSMGMAGWFIDKPNLPLGVMKTKDNELKFIVNPRPDGFRGPLAILVDSLTASTSEIFAGGLQDLGRAHVVGTRTAGAALPSVFEKLPNSDGFQYAVANYISEGGKTLEGTGVSPDEQVKLTRQALLAGQDPVLEAALNWIAKQGKEGHQQ